MSKSKAKMPENRVFGILNTGKEMSRAVVEVFHATETPGADALLILDYHFFQIRTAVVKKWATLTGFDPEEFPFRDDAVRSLWLSYRKATADNRKRIREFCDADPSLELYT